jgi:2-C-methyl-D-erythritol 4-phosphate cytidylyltransferase
MKTPEKHAKVIAIVPAAGKGKRFGPETNKSFQMLGGKPLIIWSLETLQSVDAVIEIIPVLKTEDMEHGQVLFAKYNLSKIKRIAPGGKERQESVHNGLKLIADTESIILIHDGARPLIAKELVKRAISELSNSAVGTGRQSRDVSAVEGVIVGVPVKDTIKEVEAGRVKKTLPRSSLWAVQTPQVFPYKNISTAYLRAMEDGYSATDDAALIEKYGGRIRIITGSYRNIKITTPEDLEIAEFLIANNIKQAKADIGRKYI